MGSPDPLITFRRVSKHAGLRRADLEGFAQLLRKRVATGREFHCRVTSDAEMRRLNKEYLGKDYATDVLSFPFLAESVAEGPGLGDLAISWERADSQAREFGHTLDQELQLLMLHGVLHLMGMDHERDRGEMARAEQAWRADLGLPRGLTERMSGGNRI